MAMKELKRNEDVVREKSMLDFKQTMNSNFQFHDKNDWATRALNNFEFLGLCFFTIVFLIYLRKGIQTKKIIKLIQNNNSI